MFATVLKDLRSGYTIKTLLHSTPSAFAIFAILSVALRLPFFFPDVINWDESTFIVMGQSIVDGHLPYTELWDNKPPLTFVFFAGVILLVGKSIIGIRIAGLLCVLIVALFVYWIGKHLWSASVGFWSACLWIAGGSFLPGGQATMTEHIALVPLVGSLWLLISRPPNLPRISLAGALIAIASLVRLNLAFVLLSVGLYLTLAPQPRTFTSIFKRGSVYLLSSIGVIFLTLLPYLWTGQGQVWWNSVIVAPWQYAHAKLSMFETLWVQLGYALTRMTENTPLLWLLVLGGGAGIIGTFRHRQKFSSLQQGGTHLLLLFFLSTEVSILRSGATYKHYLIQLVPFLSPFATAKLLQILAHFQQKPHWKKALIISLLTFGTLVSTTNVLGQYHYTLSRAIEQKPLPYGPAYEIAAYLREHNREHRPVYLMSHHVAYWLADSKPLSHATTHPDNISNPALLRVLRGAQHSAEDELREILCQQPKFIVKHQQEAYLDRIQTARALLEQTLTDNYQIAKQIENLYIYERISGHSHHSACIS
jgi:hypothetical protein